MRDVISSVVYGAIAILLAAAAPGCGKQEASKPVAAAHNKDDGQSSKDGDKPAPVAGGSDKLVVPPLVLPQETPKPIVAKPTAIAKKERVKPTGTVALTAEAFGAEIRKSADDAAKKFEPVFVELTGIVRTVGAHEKEAYVTLDAGPESLGIKCVLATEKEPWAKISRGSKIKLRGQWPDILVQPSLEACELIEVGPNPAQELKAEALADEFAKNKDATRKKYDEKPLIVTGVIIDAQKRGLGAVSLLLKGAGELRVDCGFNAGDSAEAKAQMRGQTVRIAGEFAAFESSDVPALRGCRVITK